VRKKGEEEKDAGSHTRRITEGPQSAAKTLVVGHCDPYGPWDPIYDPRKAPVEALGSP
jgi:hypothetical protein